MRSPGSSKVLENDDTWNRKVEDCGILSFRVTVGCESPRFRILVMLFAHMQNRGPSK